MAKAYTESTGYCYTSLNPPLTKTLRMLCVMSLPAFRHHPCVFCMDEMFARTTNRPPLTNVILRVLQYTATNKRKTKHSTRWQQWRHDSLVSHRKYITKTLHLPERVPKHQFVTVNAVHWRGRLSWQKFHGVFWRYTLWQKWKIWPCAWPCSQYFRPF